MKNLVYIHNGMETIQFRFAAGQACSICHYEKLEINLLAQELFFFKF